MKYRSQIGLRYISNGTPWPVSWWHADPTYVWWLEVVPGCSRRGEGALQEVEPHLHILLDRVLLDLQFGTQWHFLFVRNMLNSYKCSWMPLAKIPTYFSGRKISLAKTPTYPSGRKRGVVILFPQQWWKRQLTFCSRQNISFERPLTLLEQVPTCVCSLLEDEKGIASLNGTQPPS